MHTHAHNQHVREGGVVVDERCAGEADAVEVEDDVDRVDRARLVAHLHATQDDLIQEAREPVLDLGVLGDQRREREMAVHQVVVVDDAAHLQRARRGVDGERA